MERNSTANKVSCKAPRNENEDQKRKNSALKGDPISSVCSISSSSQKKQQPKPSAALLAAKRKAKQRFMTMNKKPTEFVKDFYQNAREAKDKIRKQTGIVYDKRMASHCCLWDPTYPECPERFTKVIERCEDLGLLSRCVQIDPREATDAELLSKHTQEQIDILKATSGSEDQDELEKLSSKYDAIYIHPTTYFLSRLAAGSTIELVDNVCKEKIHNGMAIIRPPGHHAMKSEYCGYCFFNNVGVAVHHALENCGLQRVLIVDWDVHHGQATQRMFYDDRRVVYFSIHRYENGTFWPNLRESDFDCIGSGDAQGYNFNVPLNATGMQDTDYLAIFQQVLIPMASEFQPELVVVSAGYDAAVGCPEGEMEITPACYAHLLNSLSALAEGKIAVVLEGGYCLRSLAEGAALTLRSLLDDPCPSLPAQGKPCDIIQKTILDVIYSHRPYWKCFQLQEKWPLEKRENPGLVGQSHTPKVRFDGPTGPPPTTFETRNCYPVQSSVFLMTVATRLNSLIANTKLLSPPHKVGLVYDSRMLKHKKQNDPSHLERPERISVIYSTLDDFGLLERCHILPGRAATEKEISLVHPAEYTSYISQLSNMSHDELISEQDNFNSVYYHSDSFESASVAAGCALEVVDSVLRGDIASGVAVVRPPGHHAESDESCGFCIFNTISIAAKYAVERHGLSRVLILDWDVHHGNGTQHVFESDPRVLYISLHRYDNGSFFPRSTDANYDHVGTGEGAGFNVNIPWNKSGMGSADYIAAFHHIVLPIAYQFNPELVLVSAGFDAAVGDPLGGCRLTPEAYGHMTHWLRCLAGGKIVVCLEGGYNLTSIAYSMTMCTKALFGDPLPYLESNEGPCPSAVETIQTVASVMSKYWSGLRFQVPLPEEETVLSVNAIGKGKIRPESGGDSVRSVAPGSSEEHRSSGDGERPSGSGISRQSDISSDGASGGRQHLVDYLSDNLHLLIQGQMFAVVPLSDCPHLPQVEPVPSAGIDVHVHCAECDSSQENWTCLVCYTVHCGRYINGHMMQHSTDSQHALCLSFADLSVWCYQCEAYIDNPALYSAKNSAHRSKFGEDLPWSYGENR